MGSPPGLRGGCAEVPRYCPPDPLSFKNNAREYIPDFIHVCGNFVSLTEAPFGGYRQPAFGVWRFVTGRDSEELVLRSDVSCGSLYGVCYLLCPRQVLGLSSQIGCAYFVLPPKTQDFQNSISKSSKLELRPHQHRSKIKLF